MPVEAEKFEGRGIAPIEKEIPVALFPIQTQLGAFDRLVKSIPDKDIAKRFSRVFDVKNLTVSLGMLKLRK